MSAAPEPLADVAVDVTVAFDWNGTLADDVPWAVAATNAVLDGVGRAALSEDEFRSAFTLPLDVFFRAVGVPVAALGAASDQWNAEMGAGPVRLMPGAAEAIRALTREGARIGVVSAASASAISGGIERLEVESGCELDFVVMAAIDKTEAISSIVLEAPGPVLYVGDTEYDIEASARGGARTVGFTAGYRPRDALAALLPEWLVDDLRQLPAIAAEVATEQETAA
jgi:phosphoglycolate phosphatase-like HAD superfamily hydrolase